jgi:hypothetical protein
LSFPGYNQPNMRVLFLTLITFLLFNCASRKAIQRTVDAHSRTFPLRQLKPPGSDTVSVASIEIKSGAPLPARSEVVNAGFFMLPLLFYNHFQAGYQVLLGQDVFDGPWQEYVDSRLKLFAADLSASGISNVKVEVSKAMANGKYITGNVYIMIPSYYFVQTQSINLSKSKHAAAELALKLSWTDASGNEESRDASIKIQVANNGIYSAHIRTLLGKTVNLSSNDINHHFTHDVISQPPYFMNEPNLTIHLFRLSDLLVLGLDELCEVVLMESREEEVKPLPPSYAADLLKARDLLWEQVRAKKLGERFSRGYSPSGGFRSGSFYDFTSNRAHLTVDVGLERKAFSVEHYLFSMGQNTSGYRHLYFTPEEVLTDMKSVLEKIRQELN